MSKVVTEAEAKQKLFMEFAERYKVREGGYTRILRTKRRINDASPMAFIEWVVVSGPHDSCQM